MLLPYRCKNPPEQVPYATIGLIVLNVIVYLFTTNDFLVIKDGIVTDYAVSPSHLNPITLLASMFLHGEPLHIGGNMLFLWLFGAAVEGRMRIPKYLLLYFISGIAGGLVQCWSEMAVHLDIPGFGASGAIMGLAGAYLYIFPYARIVVFRFFWILGFIRFGASDWLAWWVVAYYMGLNILNAIIQQSLGVSGGTAYFAHIGGFGAGLLCAFLLQVRRDGAYVSEVQATRTDLQHDFSLMKATELEALLEHPTDNLDMVLTYCEKASYELGSAGDARARAMIDRYKEPLLIGADTERLSKVVLRLPTTAGVFSGPFYLKLGGKLEHMSRTDLAANMYRRVYEVYSTAEDSGAALMRLGRLSEQVAHNPQDALSAFSAYEQYFPNGPLIEDARRGVSRTKAELSRTAPRSIRTSGREIPRRPVESVIDVSLAPPPLSPSDADPDSSAANHDANVPRRLPDL